MNKHERTKLILKIAGIAMAVCGLALAITGFADMIASTGRGSTPKLFFLMMIGLPLFAVGMMFCLTGFRREISRYMKNESVPVVNEAGKEITPAISAIAGAAKSADATICPHCGKTNSDGAKFCRHCGNKLTVTCPACGEEVSAGDFCENCGAKLK